MGLPTHFTGGVSNVGPTDPLYQFGMLDPTKWHVYFNDFDEYVAADWTVTEIGAGGTQALTDINGGALLITNDALDNDGVQLQKVGESFKLESGKKAFFKTRFKVSEATQMDWLVGLAVLDTTLLGSVDGDGVTDGIFFSKEDGDTNIDVNVQKNTTTGQNRATAIGTIAADTFITLAWYFDGKDKVTYYVNDVQKGTLDASSTYLPDTELTVSIASLNGDGNARNLTWDYVFAAIER